MLRERSGLIVQAYRVLDISVSAAAFIGAYFVKKYLLPHSLAGLTTDPNYYVILLMVIIIWYVTFDLAGLYASHR